MGLQSHLFRGDSKLEAAAVSDAAHIMPGANGPHVEKIQTALIQLDAASIRVDSVFGPSTAAAVLAYKRKRKIVNRTYETQVDNIVGKMTIAALDAEILANEIVPTRPARIVPLYPVPRQGYRENLLNASPKGTMFGVRSNVNAHAQIIIPPGPISIIELQEHSQGSFLVVDGKGGTVGCWDNSIGIVFDPAQPLAHGGTLPIGTNRQPFIVRARNIGQTFIEAKNAGTTGRQLGDLVTLVVRAESTALTWKPRIDPKFGGPITFAPYASNAFGPPPVNGIGLYGSLFEVTGTVDPDASIAVHDFELGFVQM
jgi:peptidoglycan hydrolase-like protein with peptidoglycan-binding domain